MEFNETGHFFEYLVVYEEVAGVEEADVLSTAEFDRTVHCVVDAFVGFLAYICDAERPQPIDSTIDRSTILDEVLIVAEALFQDIDRGLAGRLGAIEGDRDYAEERGGR